jgi:hypothetical protein
MTGRHKTVFGIMTFYCVIGIAYLFVIGNKVTFPDEVEYMQIASNLYNQGFFSIDGVNPTAYRPPGFPFLLASAKLVYDDVLFFKALNIAFWVISAGLVYQITTLLYSAKAGIISLVLFMLYPVNLYTAGTLYPQAFTEMLLLVSIYLAFKPGSEIKIVPISIASIALVMTVPNFLVTYLLIIFYLAVSYRNRKIAVYAFLSLFVMAAVLGAWSWRNYSAFGQNVLVSSNSGFNLLLGNSENAGANTGVNVDLKTHLEATAQMNEIEADKYYKDQAIHWISNNISAATILFCKKFLNWFNYQNNLYVKTEGNSLRNFVMAATFYPIFLFAVAGSVLGRSRLTNFKHSDLLFWAIYLTAAVTYAVFFTRIRFRIPLDAIIIILASPCILWLAHEAFLRWRWSTGGKFSPPMGTNNVP